VIERVSKGGLEREREAFTPGESRDQLGLRIFLYSWKLITIF